MPSLCLPFNCEAAPGPSLSVVGVVWSSEHMSATIWQRKHAASTGGCMYMSIRQRPSTCLYSVSEEGPSTRRRWERCSVGEACVWCYCE